MWEIAKIVLHRLSRWVNKSDPVDHFLSHPKRGLALDLVANGRWSELEDLYLQLRTDERNVLVAGIADAIKDAHCFDSWVERSDSHIALIFKGAQHVELAWFARGGAFGNQIPKSAIEQFFKLLDEANDDLYQAFKKDPKDAESLAWAIRALMGLGAEKTNIEACFERIEDAGVCHLGACFAMVQALAAKWHGSHDEMFAFVRTQLNRHPAYSSAIVHAHGERWYASNGEPDECSLTTYFRRADVRDEIMDAYRRDSLMLDSSSYFALMARNAYAFAFYQSGDLASAKPLLENIGSRICFRPWMLEDGTRISAVNRARKACGLHPLSDQ